jgi:hypothetical protein
MDEEEELENTLIGQEEEAPAMDTGDELMGAGQPMFATDSNVVATDSNVVATDSNVVAAVPGIENIRNPGAFNPANVEPVEPVGPPATIGESIRQTYDESVLADLIGRGFGQEAFQSQAPDGTPTFSIFNKRFGTLGSQVPYSEASPEAKAQAINFMLETGGQERPLPETPTSPVRTPEQVQSILNEQRATQAPPVESALGATPSVAPPLEMITAGAQEQPQTAVSPFLQSPDTPSGLGGPLLRGFEMVNDAARGPNAPMGQDATRARLGGMTLNEYLNAPAGTPGVSGLRTDPQGRMIPNIAQFQAQPETAQPAVDSDIIPAVTQAPVDSAVPTTVAQPPVDALSSFERDSLARQQRIGGTGSFAGDSAAREARLAERDRLPGETQTERDTRAAQSRTTGGQTGGLSFDDARRRAEGQLAARGVRNPSASQVNALARGIQAAEPERLAELETKRAINEARLKTAQATLDRPEFEGKVYTVNGVTFAQTSRGGAQVIDTGTETPEQSTAQMQNFEFTLDQIDKAREAYSAGDVPRANDILTAAGIQKNGIDVTANEYFGDFTPPPPPGSTPQVTDTQFDPSQLTGQDREAYNFAINNPNDERSQRILNKLGAN